MKRSEFVEQMEAVKHDAAVCIDELGIKNTVKSECGWSPRGTAAHEDRKGRAAEKLDIIAGLLNNKIVPAMIYECSTNSEIFNAQIEHALLPELPKNSVIVLDNASFHNSKKTKEIVRKFGCRLLFLPPCSPDLNPTEKFWAVMKAKIKKIVDSCSGLSGLR